MIKKVCLALAASTALIGGTAQAAADYFIKIVGIAGTSTVIGLTDYIEISSYSTGFSRGACQSLNFTKQMDAASPDLSNAALLGTPFTSATLIGRKAGAEPFIFMRLTFTNLLITSVSVGGSQGGGDTPIEQVSLQPSSVKIEAFGQDNAGNSIPLATSTVTCQKAK